MQINPRDHTYAFRPRAHVVYCNLGPVIYPRLTVVWMLYEPNLMLVHPNFPFAERETLFGGSQNRATLRVVVVGCLVGMYNVIGAGCVVC